jgi:hypothetical protein
MFSKRYTFANTSVWNSTDLYVCKEAPKRVTLNRVWLYLWRNFFQSSQKRSKCAIISKSLCLCVYFLSPLLLVRWEKFDYLYFWKWWLPLRRHCPPIHRNRSAPSWFSGDKRPVVWRSMCWWNMLTHLQNEIRLKDSQLCFTNRELKHKRRFCMFCLLKFVDKCL